MRMRNIIPSSMGRVKLVATGSSNSAGVASVTLPSASCKCWVQPTTAGEFANQVTQVGTALTIQFRKFKAAGLGITLGTLLTVSAFEDTPGVVNFNVFAAE